LVLGGHHDRQIPRGPCHVGSGSTRRNYSHPHAPNRKVLEYRIPTLLVLVWGLLHLNTHNHHDHHDSRKVTSDKGGTPIYRLGPLSTRTIYTKAGCRAQRVSHPREETVGILHRPTWGDWTRRRLTRNSIPLSNKCSVRAHSGSDTHRRSLETK
jgi:hypothetical protein